jgi:hypothetical protein
MPGDVVWYATASRLPARSSEFDRILSCGSWLWKITAGLRGSLTSTAVMLPGADSCASHSTRRPSAASWMAMPSPQLPKPFSS